jgi:hypothetical protein
MRQLHEMLNFRFKVDPVTHIVIASLQTSLLLIQEYHKRQCTTENVRKAPVFDSKHLEKIQEYNGWPAVIENILQQIGETTSISVTEIANTLHAQKCPLTLNLEKMGKHVETMAAENKIVLTRPYTHRVLFSKK